MPHILKYVCLICFLFVASVSLAQQTKLARQYFNDGEYEKAAELYKQLSNQHGRFIPTYFSYYIDCLLSIQDFEHAKSEINNVLKKRKDQVQLYVILGRIYEQQFDQKKADQNYNKALQNMPQDDGILRQIAQEFSRQSKHEFAIKAYLDAQSWLQNPHDFDYGIGNLYYKIGDIPNFIHHYLLAGAKTLPTRHPTPDNIKLNFQRLLKEEDFDELVSQLYAKIQEEPDTLFYPIMLEWTFLQQKEYKKAFRQARALDRSTDGQGSRVFTLGIYAMNDEHYEDASRCFEYITENYDKSSPYYFDAVDKLLYCDRQKILSNPNYDISELDTLEKRHEQFLADFGQNELTAKTLVSFAELQAIYLNNTDKAIEILEKVNTFPRLSKEDSGNTKLQLGDYYLIKEEIWEASLLYSQVDKANKEGQLGERARYKNARLSYFNGDFEWAQAQFDILKSATTRKISNDAIDQSVFIMDNMGLDTTTVPLELYASAELLSFQNKYDDAFAKLDSISLLFEEHSLIDDIAYAKANIYVKQREYDKAIDTYNYIIENHLEEIRCDNAIFELAQLYEEVLNQPEKAKSLYEKLFLEFSNSTFAIESRKRFRILRGDEI